eukprot:784839-Pelagomonas_calceolata.AAC.8
MMYQSLFERAFAAGPCEHPQTWDTVTFGKPHGKPRPPCTGSSAELSIVTQVSCAPVSRLELGASAVSYARVPSSGLPVCTAP